MYQKRLELGICGLLCVLQLDEEARKWFDKEEGVYDPIERDGEP